MNEENNNIEQELDINKLMQEKNEQHIFLQSFYTMDLIH